MKTKIVVIAQLSLGALFISAATTAALNDKYVQPKEKKLQEEIPLELIQLTAISSEPVETKNDLATLQLRSNQAVDWLIIGANNSNYEFNAKSRLNKRLPAGHYTVRAIFRDIALHKKIHIQAGQSLTTNLDIPLGQVRLIATKDDQPLFKTVIWDVYRVTGEKRKLIGKYNLHSRSISMPPGRYEAIASYKDIKGKRQFQIQEGRTNDVILALK